MFEPPFSLPIAMGPALASNSSEEVLYSPEDNKLLARADLWIPSLTEELQAYLARHPEKLYQLSPRKFEELIASVFANQGFDVELTPETRDGGFDVLAIRKDNLTGESKYLVECKRYAPDRRINVGVVRQLLGVVVDHQATKGIVATTCFFTDSAVKFEEQNRCRLATSGLLGCREVVKESAPGII